MPDLSVIIVSWNTHELLARCLDALDDACRDIVYETIVVDNGSTDGTLDMLHRRASPVHVIVNTENLGFAVANNQGLARVAAPVALLLNSDAFINRDAIDSALQLMEHQPRAGLVGVKVLNQDGSLQAAQGTFPTLRDDLATSIGFDQLRREQRPIAGELTPADWVHGSCLFVRTSAARAVGGFDRRFFMYSEEVEWCHRFWRSGWEVWYDPGATVVHLGGASSTRDDVRRRSALYRSRIGLRRHMSGPASSALLWGGMTAGLAGRIVVRGAVRLLARRELGRQTIGSDLRLLREVVRMDPLARWSVS